MMKYIAYVVIIPLFLSTSFPMQKNKVSEPKLKTYYLALLRKGPRRDQDSITAAKIQDAHLANIRRLYNEGKLDLAGPFLDGGDLQGIFVLNVANMEEAKKLADEDPAVKAGRLILEIHPWMSQPGAKLR